MKTTKGGWDCQKSWDKTISQFCTAEELYGVNILVGFIFFFLYFSYLFNLSLLCLLFFSLFLFFVCIFTLL